MRWTAVALALIALPASAATHYVTVAGLGGEPDYEKRFEGLAKELDKILQGSGGEVKVHTLHGADSTRAKLRETLEGVAREAVADDTLVMILIGHGTFDGSEYKFNLKGPDVSAEELAAFCDKVAANRQLVVNATSASGASISRLQKANRTIISATRSGTQKNATVFARFVVEALRDPTTDVDKNEVVSALEVFRYADRKTAAFYESAKRLATEHAVIEDTGKGEAVRQPNEENGKGNFAGRLAVLRLGSVQKAAADPAKQSLIRRKEDIENQIDRLKLDKPAMPADQYRKQLTALLLELARVQEEIDK